MFRRFFAFFLLLPLGIFVIYLSVVNRDLVTLNLPPLFSYEVPLFWIIFLSFLVGLFVGGFLTWLRRLRRRDDNRAH